MFFDSARDQEYSLIALGVFVLILMFFLSWSFRSGNVIAGSFQVDDIQICEDIDDNMKPVRRGVVLPGGVSRACLWFQYSKAREGDSLEIIWSHEDHTLQKDVFRIAKQSGVRAFYLMKEDRSPLPPGDYTVELICNGKKKTVREFAIQALKNEIHQKNNKDTN